jgi:hypothetical protein
MRDFAFASSESQINNLNERHNAGPCLVVCCALPSSALSYWIPLLRPSVDSLPAADCAIEHTPGAFTDNGSREDGSGADVHRL